MSSAAEHNALDVVYPEDVVGIAQRHAFVGDDPYEAAQYISLGDGEIGRAAMHIVTTHWDIGIAVEQLGFEAAVTSFNVRHACKQIIEMSAILKDPRIDERLDHGIRERTLSALSQLNIPLARPYNNI